MPVQTIGITGGDGFVGTHLTDLLVSKGFNVIIFTRNIANKKPKSQVTYAQWDAEKETCDINQLSMTDVMVHLAGAGIADKRWSEKRKQEITNSRVKGTSFLVAQLKAHAPECKTLISASATGFYGPDRFGVTPFSESAKHYSDFLGETCSKWEAEAHKAEALVRTVILRFGIVLGKESGAFPQFSKPMSYGVMPILGSGNQIVSWIEVDDLANLILFAIEHADVHGVYNAVAPNPVAHKKLMKTIARIKGGIKIPVPVPAFVLKAMLGEMSEEVLKSCTVSAQKITDAGFIFKYGDIKSAVRGILGA